MSEMKSAAAPDEGGHFGPYGGRFVPETLMGPLSELEAAFRQARGDPSFRAELDDLLRQQWGFDGYVVSDCDAISDIWRPQLHHYVNTPEEAAAAAVKAGCNLCCGGDYNALVRAVQKELITEKEIDKALYYTFWTRFRLGLFDPAEKVPYSKITIADNDTPEHRQLALQIARQTLVLLKNDGILPLDRARFKRIAVIGPNADSVPVLQGNYNGTASHPVTILKGIRQAVTNMNIEVSYAQGCPLTTETGRGFGRRGAPARTLHHDFAHIAAQGGGHLR